MSHRRALVPISHPAYFPRNPVEDTSTFRFWREFVEDRPTLPRTYPARLKKMPPDISGAADPRYVSAAQYRQYLKLRLFEVLYRFPPKPPHMIAALVRAIRETPVLICLSPQRYCAYAEAWQAVLQLIFACNWCLSEDKARQLEGRLRRSDVEYRQYHINVAREGHPVRCINVEDLH